MSGSLHVHLKRFLKCFALFDGKSPVSRNTLIQMSDGRNIFKTINVSCDRKELNMLIMIRDSKHLNIHRVVNHDVGRLAIVDAVIIVPEL